MPVRPASPAKPAPRSGTPPKASRKVVSAPAVDDCAWVVRRSKIQGRGVFARRPIAKGERIIEYVGEYIDHEEAGRRYDDEAMERHHTFLFAIDADTCIDGGRQGNEARFINHSCAPNCVSKTVRRRVFVHAKRAIAAGEELFFDYAYELEGPITAADVKRYPCRCGTDVCRGSLLAPALIEEAAAHTAAKKAAAAKRRAAKKAAAKKSAAKKAAAKKAPAKKPAAKKTPAKKPAAKKTPAKKPAAKKAPAKKPAAKKARAQR